MPTSLVDCASGVKVSVRYARAPLQSPHGTTALVFTHPYGPMGGNADNNVVQALFQHFGRQGYNVVAFDFRGSGKSTGSTSYTASPEAEDTRKVVEFILSLPAEPGQHAAISRIVMCGYSYGSVVAGLVVDDIPQVIGFVAIAYPFSVLWFLTCLHQSSVLAKAKTCKPKLFIQGDRDNFTSKSSFESYIDSFENKEIAWVEGSDHFFWSSEGRLIAPIERWLAKL